MSYLEMTVRDVVDVIRIQVENNIKALEEEQAGSFDLIKKFP